MHSSVLSRLTASTHAAMIVDLAAIRENYRFLATQIRPAQCFATLKGDAYGTGVTPAVKALYQAGCRHFFASDVDDAIRVKETVKEADVYVFGGYLPGTETAFKEHNLIPVIQNINQLERLSQPPMQTPMPAVLNIDTGMTHKGLSPKEVQTIAQTPRLLSGIDLRLITSQLVYHHEENPDFTKAQSERFDRARALLPKAPASLGKTGTCFLENKLHYDVVNPGIGLFGCSPVSSLTPPLKPVVHIYARIYQIQEVAEGESVGYCQDYVAPTTHRVATLAIGYTDGYPWRLANKGCVTIDGHKAPIIGRISMDLLTVDVTNVPESSLKNGAWVQIVGENNTINQMAVDSGLSPHVILTGLGKRFQRIYVGENAHD